MAWAASRASCPTPAANFDAEVVQKPKMLAAGIGTTGPLARSLFFLGLCEEQALVARIQDKGLVVIILLGSMQGRTTPTLKTNSPTSTPRTQRVPTKRPTT